MTTNIKYKSVSYKDVSDSDDELLDDHEYLTPENARCILGESEDELSNTDSNRQVKGLCQRIYDFVFMSKTRKFIIMGIAIVLILLVLFVVVLLNTRTDHVVHDPDLTHKDNSTI